MFFAPSYSVIRVLWMCGIPFCDVVCDSCIFVREMYSAQLCDQTFQQKYQAWMLLLEKLESELSNGISGNDFSVREQLAVHQVRCLFISIYPLGTLCALTHSLTAVSGCNSNVLIGVHFWLAPWCNMWLLKNVIMSSSLIGKINELLGDRSLF